MEGGRHAELMAEAIAADGDAYRAMLEVRPEAARERLRAAVELYRRSWELAPPRSYGRLVAMLKSAVLAGDGEAAAEEVLAVLRSHCDSPTSCYALAVALLVRGRDGEAGVAAERMREGGDAFARAAEALAAIAAGDGERYAAAVRAIVADFEGRDAHLTGVAIADTALLTEALAASRGLAARPESGLVPRAV